jgi:hypothetical protein
VSDIDFDDWFSSFSDRLFVTDSSSTSDSSSADDAGSPGPTLAAFKDVFAPLAKLAVARGVRYGELDELLKVALIEAAKHAHADVPVQRAVSRISAATGINRREVTRLIQEQEPARHRPRSAVTEVFARWVSEPQYGVDTQGRRLLPRLGEAPSFEALAASVNKDVRPRTLLDELCRLGLARINDDDTVELLKDNFVPSSDETQMLAFLGHNVGDHLTAAVENVVSPGVRHLEQALFSNELSAHSIEEVRPEVGVLWKALVQKLAPVVQQLMDEDRATVRPLDQRLRIGMYMYSGPTQAPPLAKADDAGPQDV